MYYVVNNIYRSKIYGNNYTKDRKRAKGLPPARKTKPNKRSLENVFRL